MRFSTKYPILKHFEDLNFKDNQLIYSRKVELGFFEVYYFRNHFDVYYRLDKQKYGYFISSFSTYQKGYDFLNSNPDIDLVKFLPTEIVDYVNSGSIVDKGHYILSVLVNSKHWEF